MDEETYWFKNILNPQHPYHRSYLKILEDDCWKDPKVYDWGCHNIRESIPHPLKQEEIYRKILSRIYDNEDGLAACGVEYFDCYLMHGLSGRLYERFVESQAFDVVRGLKEDGRVRHIGISFHDKPDVLERILDAHPEIEVVQIQLNYLDHDDPVIEGGRVYKVCRRYGKPVIVMEPVRGGGLAKLPDAAQKYVDRLGGCSPASLALRYAASFEGVEMVLSGMSSEEQVDENIRTMKDLRPLNEQESAALERIKEVFRGMGLIPCTACRYCMPGCPQNILIPRLFACLNARKQFVDWDNSSSYEHYTGTKYGRASDCIGCGQCEEICPQHLPVAKLLGEVARMYDSTQAGVQL